jgi:hypothetical protein
VNPIVAWLKALVIGMGVLIVVGVGVVAVTLVNRMGGAPTASTAPAATTPTVTPPASRIVLPEGAHMMDARVEGDHVLLRIALADGTTRVVIYTLDGKPLSTFDVGR